MTVFDVVKAAAVTLMARLGLEASINDRCEDWLGERWPQAVDHHRRGAGGWDPHRPRRRAP
jgi:hypothetical protein